VRAAANVVFQADTPEGVIFLGAAQAIFDQ
jgi:hypothetical protein